jgi:hypothetical protein
MEPTQSGGVLGDLTRVLKGPAAAAAQVDRPWWHDLHWYRRAAVELAIIAAVLVTLALYVIAVIAFARWAL